ncbi:MAG TPA: CofH family radical SAM protein, partial [Anaeromyxobacter sp.]
MTKLRAAAVSFLNARPLWAGLEKSERIELVLAEPSRCAAMLEAGEVDMALVSVGALPGGGEYEIVPGIAIGADGPVQTVVLAGEQSPAIWDEVFLDTASRTSHVLTKLVLDDMGVHPKFTLLPAEEGLARAKGTKGALVIGDRGFDVRANHVMDLGREWTRMTGLPMIFALWAARPGRVTPEDVQELTRAAQHGLGIRTELARAFAREKGGDPEKYRRYLTQRVRYGLGPFELQGLEEFLGRAAAKGFLPPMKLRFVDDVVRTRRARRRVSLDTALQKGADGERLDADEAELLDEKAPLLELGLAADLRRRSLHPEGVVTYIVSRNVNYTNVCTTACHFCAFYRPRGHAESYVLTREQLTQKIDETVALGGIEILLQGGLHPDLAIEWYEDLFRWVKASWPTINLHALSPEEIWHIARTSQLDLGTTIDRLVAAGLDSIPGGGAEVLDDEVRRRIAPLKCSTDEWLEVMRAAHEKGLKSTATLMFGVGEEARHRVAHLMRLRELQDQTGGFTAFICWPFQSAHTRLEASDTSAHAYLRTNALSRLVLDNVPNLQASWVTMGGGVAQASLHMG